MTLPPRESGAGRYQTVRSRWVDLKLDGEHRRRESGLPAFGGDSPDGSSLNRNGNGFHRVGFGRRERG